MGCSISVSDKNEYWLLQRDKLHVQVLGGDLNMYVGDGTVVGIELKGVMGCNMHEYFMGSRFLTDLEDIILFRNPRALDAVGVRVAWGVRKRAFWKLNSDSYVSLISNPDNDEIVVRFSVIISVQGEQVLFSETCGFIAACIAWHLRNGGTIPVHCDMGMNMHVTGLAFTLQSRSVHLAD